MKWEVNLVRVEIVEKENVGEGRVEIERMRDEKP